MFLRVLALDDGACGIGQSRTGLPPAKAVVDRSVAKRRYRHSPAEPRRVHSASNENELPRIAVLIVDDDDDARELLADLVRKAGYSVATACDGREAIEHLRRSRPDLILLDVVMPGMDGASFRQEQRRNRDWIRIPTIVLTGAADEPVLDVAVEDTLRKPVSARTLLELVTKHCTRDSR